ncbi:hypothetical protein AAW51_1869 [Caldimonas brevitalea]|uniref:DUF4123 domain-containing protein n=1 Tax=Caldimonas brevitalea TaxID=413882 RepID=A0A0G3BPR5_9BURK|nr:hypothetical protein AAW51_1869 [Caldimonas brevitalea]
MAGQTDMSSNDANGATLVTAGGKQAIHPHSLQELQAVLDPMAQVFVLVDPLVSEPFALEEPGTLAGLQAQREAFWQRPLTRIELPGRVALPVHHHPYLVELQGRTDPLLAETFERAQADRVRARADGLDGVGMSAQPIGGWLQCSLYGEQLAQVLLPLLQVNTEARTDAKYLRLTDRRVLALLRSVVGDARIECCFGALQAWASLDVHGHITVLRSHGAIAENQTPPRLRLSREEWLQMMQGASLHRILDMSLGALEQQAGLASRLEAAPRYSAALTHRPGAELFGPAQAALACANEAAQRWPHRFTGPQDFIVWGALSLLHRSLRSVKGVPPSVDELMRDQGTPDEPAEPLRYQHAEVSRRARDSAHD